MRLIFLLVAALALGSPLSAQTPDSSSKGADLSSPQSGGEQLPVSLDRIREGLQKVPDQGLRNLDVQPDFRMHIEDQARIDAIMSKLDFKTGPAPAGGLYAFEQQRRLFNPTDRPLQQPYAAFSGGELITIAIENLMARYLGGRVMSAMSSEERGRAEGRARQEVDQAIADYCAERPDRHDIQLCTSPAHR